MRGFTTFIVIFAITALATFATGMFIYDHKAPKELDVGADPRIFTSRQVGTSPTADYILSTDGTNSIWIEDTGSSGGGLFEYDGDTDAITPIVASTSIHAFVQADHFVASSTATSSTFTLASTTALTATRAYLTQLANLTSNGFVKTGSSNGTLSIDTTTYDQVTTAGDGITRTANDFDCDIASGTVFGCLSTANWTTFNGKQDTITAGDALTLTGTDIDFDGGATPSGDLGNTWASPSVTDDSHAHTGTTLSGIDISGDTNLTVTATGLELALDAIALTTGYTIPLSASTTNWNGFYDTPSTRITAGTGIDWAGNTLNGVYTAGDGLTLTGEDFDFDGGTAPSGELGGTWGSITIDDSIAVSSWNLTTPTFTTNFTFDSVIVTGLTGVDVNVVTGTAGTNGNCVEWNADGDIVDAGAACGTGGGGGLATTTDNNPEVGETVSYITTDLYLGGSSSSTAVFNFDMDSSKLTISSTTNSTTTITGTDGAVRLAGPSESTEFNFNTANTLTLFSDTGVSLFDFGTLNTKFPYASSTGISGTNLDFTNATTTSFFSTLGTFTNLIVNTLSTFLNVTITGLLDLGGGVLEIPNGTAPTVDSIGELALDSTSNQLVLYGSEKKVIGNGNEYTSFTYATTTVWTGTTTLPLGPGIAAETWNSISCFTDVGTLNVGVGDGTNYTNNTNASTTVGVTTLTSNNTFTAGEKRYFRVGTPASSPTTISCTISKSLTAD
jgi:hypothetical protein